MYVVCVYPPGHPEPAKKIRKKSYPLVASQLNGAQGEVTGNDDHGHQQGPRRENLNKSGSSRRGGNGNGPPPNRPPGRAPENRPKDQSGSLSYNQEDTIGANGDIQGLLTNVNLVTEEEAVRAGRLLGKHSAAKATAQADALPSVIAREDGIQLARARAHDWQETRTAERAEAAKDADAERATAKERFKMDLNLEELDHIQRLEIEKVAACIISKAEAEHRVAMTTLDPERQEQLRQLAVLAAVVRVQAANHADVIRAEDEALQARHAQAVRNHHLNVSMAVMEHELTEARTGGPKVKLDDLVDLIRWEGGGFVPDHPLRRDLQDLIHGNPGRTYAPHNAGLMGNERYVRCVANVPLAAALMFEKRTEPGFLKALAQWVGGGFLGAWKKTIDLKGKGAGMTTSYKEWGWDSQWVAPELGRPCMSGEDVMGSTTLHAEGDRRRARSILKDYQLLGVSFSFFRSLICGSDDFITRNEFNSTRQVWVHPTLYQLVTQKLIGQQLTATATKQALRQFKDHWSQYIPITLYYDTIDLACQHIESLNHTSSLSAPKLKGKIGDA